MNILLGKLTIVNYIKGSCMDF